MTLSSADLTVAAFNSIPGQGVVYSVIVRDPLLNTSASYVPVHTYACSFASTLDNCGTLGETFTRPGVVVRRSCDTITSAGNKLISNSHEILSLGLSP